MALAEIQARPQAEITQGSVSQVLKDSGAGPLSGGRLHERYETLVTKVKGLFQRERPSAIANGEIPMIKKETPVTPALWAEIPRGSTAVVVDMTGLPPDTSIVKKKADDKVEIKRVDSSIPTEALTAKMPWKRYISLIADPLIKAWEERTSDTEGTESGPITVAVIQPLPQRLIQNEDGTTDSVLTDVKEDGTLLNGLQIEDWSTLDQGTRGNLTAALRNQLEEAGVKAAITTINPIDAASSDIVAAQKAQAVKTEEQEIKPGEEAPVATLDARPVQDIDATLIGGPVPVMVIGNQIVHIGYADLGADTGESNEAPDAIHNKLVKDHTNKLVADETANPLERISVALSLLEEKQVLQDSQAVLRKLQQEMAKNPNLIHQLAAGSGEVPDTDAQTIKAVQETVRNEFNRQTQMTGILAAVAISQALEVEGTKWEDKPFALRVVGLGEAKALAEKTATGLLGHPVQLIDADATTGAAVIAMSYRHRSVGGIVPTEAHEMSNEAGVQQHAA